MASLSDLKPRTAFSIHLGSVPAGNLKVTWSSTLYSTGPSGRAQGSKSDCLLLVLGLLRTASLGVAPTGFVICIRLGFFTTTSWHWSTALSTAPLTSFSVSEGHLAVFTLLLDSSSYCS